MKKRLCAHCIKRYEKAIRKIQSRGYCSCSRIEQCEKFLRKANPSVGKKIKSKKSRQRWFFWFSKTCRLLAKLVKVVGLKAFGL